MRAVARTYFDFKQELGRDNKMADFYGTRDFYALIKQITSKILKGRVMNPSEVNEIVVCDRT